MICPNCKCEYIRGVTQCADCDVPLVDALSLTGADSTADARIVAVWRGSDPAELERVKESLGSAGIPFTTQDIKSAFNFPNLEVWASEADQDRARKILEDLDDRAHPDDLTPAEIESLAIPESDGVDNEEQPSERQDLSEHWYEDEPVAEVWKGESEEFAAALIACLREVGIRSHEFSEAGHWRLVVRSEQESRAREIVREVVEASPPE